MKKALIGLVVVIAVVAGGGVYLWLNAGSIVKTIVEKAGSEVTKVKVALNEVDLGDVTGGKAALRGLTVGNPNGFKTDTAFSLGEVSVKVDPGTIASDVIVVKEVVIAKPQITYEFGSGGSNIGTIQKNVEQATGGGKSSGGGSKSADSGEAGPKLVIENVYVRDGRVDVSADFLQGKKVGAPLPAIHLKDIGKEGGKNTGASPAEVAEKIIAAISKSATGAVSGLNVSAIKDALGKELGDAAAKLGSGATDVKKALEKGTGGADETLKEGASDAKEGIKKLFGK